MTSKLTEQEQQFFRNRRLADEQSDFLAKLRWQARHRKPRHSPLIFWIIYCVIALYVGLELIGWVLG